MLLLNRSHVLSDRCRSNHGPTQGSVRHNLTQYIKIAEISKSKWVDPTSFAQFVPVGFDPISRLGIVTGIRFHKNRWAYSQRAQSGSFFAIKNSFDWENIFSKSFCLGIQSCMAQLKFHWFFVFIFALKIHFFYFYCLRRASSRSFGYYCIEKPQSGLLFVCLPTFRFVSNFHDLAKNSPKKITQSRSIVRKYLLPGTWEISYTTNNKRYGLLKVFSPWWIILLYDCLLEKFPFVV